MPRNPEQDRPTVIAQALSRGMTTGQISGVMGISKRTVTRVSANLKKYGSPKPPPSGAKQGRPAKVTKTQAEALLAWITARDYTFYVKDLVEFLKATHGYKGCDGTVRRALIRAGFRRKEPYRKSEITHWLPPSHPVSFTVIADDDDSMLPDGESSPVQPEQDLPHSDQTQAQTPSINPLVPPHIQTSQPPTFDQLTAVQPAQPEDMQIDQHTSQDLRLDPALRAPQPQMPMQTQMPQSQTILPPRQNVQPSQSQASNAASSTSAQAKKLKAQRVERAGRADDTMLLQMDALQNTVAQQNELIKHLQQQLIQSQAQNMAMRNPLSTPTPQYSSQER